MTVQEWVASLPSLDQHEEDHHEHVDHEEDHHERDDHDEELEDASDNIILGEEASYFTTANINTIENDPPTVVPGVKNFGQLLLQKNNKSLR